jgi:hypothetical protein
LYALGFSVDSDDPAGATAEEILIGIAERLAELMRTGEVLESVGMPEDSVVNGTGMPPGAEKPEHQATAAANAAKRSPGSRCRSRQVMAIGSSDWWLT